jgi:hypothetical protein
MPSATQPSESDAAVHLVSGWTIGQLADTVIAFETHDLWRLGIVTDIQKFAALKRAVVLHTDVAALAMAGPKAPDLVWVSAVPAPHIGAALELVEWLREHGSGGKIFALDWYRTVAALLASEHEIQSTPAFMDWALARFRGDARLLVLSGAVHELLASPAIQEGFDLRGADKGGSADAAGDAQHVTQLLEALREPLRLHR